MDVLEFMSDATTIPGFLEQKFHEEKFNNIEIINAGNRAASSFEEAYSIRSNYKNLQPDLFIIYDGWNDSFRKMSEKDFDEAVRLGAPPDGLGVVIDYVKDKHRNPS